MEADDSLNTLLRSHEPCDWLDKVQDAFSELVRRKNSTEKLLEEMAQCFENNKNAYGFGYERNANIEGSIEWQFERVMKSYEEWKEDK